MRPTIAEMVEAIPAAEQAEHAGPVEATLLEHARTSDPRTVKLLGQRILAHLDPDGPSPEEQRPAAVPSAAGVDPAGRRHRPARGPPHPDLSGDLGDHPHPAGRERPDDALGSDDRTPAQRLHDAFEEAGRRLLATGDLPDQAGLPCQLIVTMSLTDLERRAGRATTHHGGTLSINDALRLAAEAQLLPAVLDEAGGILAYGHERRLAANGLRKALFARDRGCTFPGCPRTAAQSEIHHATDWALGGRTDLDNLAIACGYHNSGGAEKGLAHDHDRRHPTLATTPLAPRPAATTQLPPPPRTTQAINRIAVDVDVLRQRSHAPDFNCWPRGSRPSWPA